MRISADLRQKIFETAQFRCGYCLTSQHIVGPLLEIDHIIPESLGGTSDEVNLWVACPLCNSHKSDKVLGIDPDTGILATLYNPRTQNWYDHFDWIEGGTMVSGKTPHGRITVELLNINAPDMITTRHLWVLAGWHPPER